MRADGSIVWLDDVIGPGWALLAVDCEGGFPDLADPLWERLAPRSIALALGERQPPASEPPVISVSEADQPFEQLEAASGQLVLLRPDRFVFGVFEASRETGFATLLRDRIGRVEIERT